MNKPIIIALSLVLIFLAEAARSETQEASAQDEIQVLIDVSGSMKQNDPKNQRIEATKLLISLLPETSKASIWVFAEKTSALTRSDSVDAAWKKQALKSTRKIHSQGLYTNIEDAIQTVLNSGFKGKGQKHLILLTDGVVDISKDIMVSADSRERILSEWIPKLQQENIHVETIALSDQADKELLDKLAFDTGGWTENAQSAELLQRAFLKMAQQAAPKDTVPLTGNQFSVDGGIKEFSVLAFKKPNSTPTQLLNPKQKKINKQTNSPDIAWLNNPAYDLITVKQPGVGNWRLEAEANPDNQVMIVTDLKMRLEPLANFLAVEEPLDLKVSFTDHGKMITRADFLSMINIGVSVDQQAPKAMQPVSGEPGFFAQSVEDLSPGKHSLKIIADGKTFQREILKEVEVIASPIRVEKTIDSEKRTVKLSLLPDPVLLDIRTLAVEVGVSREGQPPERRPVVARGGVWAISLDEFPPGAEITINFNATVKTLGGKSISPRIKPITIDDSIFVKHDTPGGIEPATESPAAEEHPQQVEEPEVKHEASPPTTINWLLVGGVVLFANLLLFGAGYLAYRHFKKVAAEKREQLIGRLS